MSMTKPPAQYAETMSSKGVGDLVKRGTEKVVQGATLARKVQGKYKDAKYAQIGANIRATKTAYEESQAKQKESLKARTDAAEMEKFQAAKAARPAAANIRKKIKRIEAGYPVPQKAGASLSSAQQRGPAAPTSSMGGV